MTVVAGGVTCLTVGAGAPWEAAFVTACGAPDAAVRVVGRCVELGELLAKLRIDPPDAVVCDATVPWLDGEVVAAVAAAGSAAVAVGEHGTARLHRLGFTTAVNTADPLRLVDAVVEAARPLPRPEPHADRFEAGGDGLVVVVWGPKGGTGRTTVAVNLAWEIARDGAECVLVDADTYGGSVALALELPERPNVATLARDAGRGELVAARAVADLAEPAPGLHVLAGMARPQAWPDLRGRDLAALLTLLRTAAQVVVVDAGACLEDDEELLLTESPWRRNQAAIAALAVADRVYAVVGSDPASVRHAVLSAPEVEAAGCRPGLVHTLVARSRSRAAGRQVLEQLNRACGWQGGALLPEDPAAVDALWAGRALAEIAPRSRLRRAIRSVSRGLGADWASGMLGPAAPNGVSL